MEEERYKEKKFIDNMSPKGAFKVGLFSGLAIIFAIGFFVLLGMMLSGGENKISINKSADTNKGSVAQENNQPTNTNQPTNNTSITVQPVSDEDWVRGNKDAKVTVIEFSDTECPFCKRFHGTMQQVVEDYDGQVNWVYRHWPIPQLHSKAQKEAEATECAGEQQGNDGFWAYIDRIFEITPSNDGLAESQLSDIASYVGLNVGKFEECLASGRYAEKVKDQAAQAQAAGGRGTPHSIIISGDQKISVPGAVPIENIKSAIDSLL